MTVKIGINGFGRIGRNLLRAVRSQGADLDVVAVNDLTDPASLANLLKFDSVMGRFDGIIAHGEASLTVDGQEIKVTAEKDPANLPWKELGAEIVVESTGRFTNADEARKHLE